MNNIYRVVTDGEVFKIELFVTATYRSIPFFGKLKVFEEWLPCDNVGNLAVDDEYGVILPEEIKYYSSLDEAKKKIDEWKNPVIIPENPWKTVYTSY